ncbi:hypothetical protein [Kamptonema sp. UHCC 0994]|nr:hypothetical protein [Kamptonema sp. UHCC 0994]MDF0556007.1 hypothetical protein [Kamptonema sp. UHCC 0994]
MKDLIFVTPPSRRYFYRQDGGVTRLVDKSCGINLFGYLLLLY